MISGVSMSSADRRENLGRVVADVGVYGRAGRQRSTRSHQESVAVGIGGGDELAADAAAGPAAVFDDDGLSEHHSKPLGDDARHAVGRSARREGYDHLDRLLVADRLRVARPAAVQHPSGASNAVSKALIILAVSRLWSVSADLHFILFRHSMRQPSKNSRSRDRLYRGLDPPLSLPSGGSLPPVNSDEDRAAVLVKYFARIGSLSKASLDTVALNKSRYSLPFA